MPLAGKNNKSSADSLNYDERQRSFALPLILERTAFYGLIITIALAAIPYGTVDAWFKSMFVSLACLFAALRIIEAILSGTFPLVKFSLLAPAFGILLLAIVQILPLDSWAGNNLFSATRFGNTISFDSFETRNFIFIFTGLLLTAETLLRYTNSKRRLIALVCLVLAIGGGSAGFAFVQQLLSNQEILGASANNQTVLYGQFVNRNHFAFLMEMTLGISLGIMLKADEPYLKFLCRATAVATVIAIVWTNSRGAILSTFGLGLFAVFIYFLNEKNNTGSNPKRKAQTISPLRLRLKTALAITVFSCLFFGMAVFAIAFIGGDPLVSRIETIQSEMQSETDDRKIQRSEIWQSTIELIEANPIAGVGFGAYPAAITAYDKSSGERSLQQAHNDYLETLANGGIVAFLLMLIFLAALVKNTCRQLVLTDHFRRASCFGAAIGMFAALLHSFTDFGFHTTINALVFVVLIVIAVAPIENFAEI
jgi:O-antigen ligase